MPCDGKQSHYYVKILKFVSQILHIAIKWAHPFVIRISGWKSSNPRPTNRLPVFISKLPVLKRQKMGKCAKSLSDICQVTTQYECYFRKYCSMKMYLPSLLLLVFIAGAVVAYLSLNIPYGLLSLFSNKQIGTDSNEKGSHDTSLVFRVRQQQMPQTEGNIHVYKPRFMS